MTRGTFRHTLNKEDNKYMLYDTLKTHFTRHSEQTEDDKTHFLTHSGQTDDDKYIWFMTNRIWQVRSVLRHYPNKHMITRAYLWQTQGDKDVLYDTQRTNGRWQRRPSWQTQVDKGTLMTHSGQTVLGTSFGEHGISSNNLTVRFIIRVWLTDCNF